jgi:GYF domain 2/PilZ domain
MHKFFVATNGIQKGPWTLDEIKNNLAKKVISWHDHIYDDKIDSWLFLFEHHTLTEEFNKSFSNPILSSHKLIGELDIYKDRTWHILKENCNYGPFTTVEMIQMLQTKTLLEYDYVWRHGQASWKRLSEISDFKPEKVKVIFESPQYEFNQSNVHPFFRRRYPRVDYKSQLFVHDNRRIFNAESLEIGYGGLSFVIANVDLEIDHEIHLHFKSGSDLPPFNAVCKIVNKSGNKYGVSFVKIESSILDIIALYTKDKAV